MKTRNRKRETAQRSVLQFSYHSHYLFGVLLLLVILLSIWIKAHVFQILLVPSGSMENTCMSGDFLLATVYDKMDIQRYDIIAFHCPDNPDLICLERVAGLPGDCILVASSRRKWNQLRRVLT